MMGLFSKPGEIVEVNRYIAYLLDVNKMHRDEITALYKATDELRKPKIYEYRHIANNQFSKLKDSIVELMNEGWETFGGIEKERQAYQSETEYSQIMRKVK